MMTDGEAESIQAQLTEDSTVMTLQASDLVSSLSTDQDIAQLQENGTKGDFEVSDGCEEPPVKRPRTASESDSEINADPSVKQLILTINKAISLRLDGIESKLETVFNRVRVLEEKVDTLLGLSRQNSSMMSTSSSRRGAVIVGLPQNGTKIEAESRVNAGGVQNLGPQVTLITLNTEEDFPTGTWLGDENNPEKRVRVPITPSDLLHVHSNCRTPEKMALTLLDYLFDRETQAASNLSGMGKHGKKQLDPLMIYGVRCHLIHRFGITENDWHRIKQNIDSKCRTAWRRRHKGMSLSVKAFRGKTSANYVGMNNHMGDELSPSDEDSISQDGELHIQQQGEIDLQAAVAMAGNSSQQGEIQILHATAEQITQLQQAHHIQILSGDQVIGQLQPGDLNLPDGCQVTTLTTETGEVLQIQHNAVTADVPGPTE